MAKLLRLRNLAVFLTPLLVVLSIYYVINHYGNNSNVFVPVVQSNMLFKDGNVDISIQRVDELHLHQDGNDAARGRVNGAKDREGEEEEEEGREEPAGAVDFPQSWGDRSPRGGNESRNLDGAEVAIPDMHDGRDMFDSSMMGFLNYDVWNWIVGYLVDDMRIVREFPLHPDERKKISKLHFEFNEVDPADVKGRYGHKVYGYIIPPEPGPYFFKVEQTQMTAASDVELWISTDSDPFSINKVMELLYADMRPPPPTRKPPKKKSTPKPSKPSSRLSKRQAKGNKEDVPEPSKVPLKSRAPKRVAVTKIKESSEVSLESSVHYFEFLEKAFEGKIATDLLWKTPGSTKYVPIPSSCFAMALKLSSNGTALDGPATHLLQGPLPSNQLQGHHQAYAVSDTVYPITDLDVLPKCEYTSLYAKPHRIKPYHGVYEVHESKVEPRDDTWYKHWKKKDKGNPVIDAAMVKSVLSLYNASLATSAVKGSMIGLRSMEETPNKNDGSRFLLEMDIQLHQPKEETVHTSEYVYLKKGSSQLCHTSNFQWTKNAEVHFVVSVKNLGMWVRHLIYNMEDIYTQTSDEHFSLIIVDYESEDMDIEKEAKKSTFKRIKVLHEKGGFSRSGGLQAGINSVKDENSIVMTIDMHLTLPTGIVEYARRHTVQYKMAFAPMFFRLNKGYTEINYNGFWETLTYGLFSMYKSDWVKFGGFNTRKFKTKWGGEDWDIVDRALAKGFEAFRMRPPGLVHYHHTRKGMWGNSEIKFTRRWSVH